MTDNRTLSQALDTALDAITRAEISLGEARVAVTSVQSKIAPIAPIASAPAKPAEFALGIDFAGEDDTVVVWSERVENAAQEPAEATPAPSATNDGRLSAKGLLERLRGRFERAVLPPFETRGDDR